MLYASSRPPPMQSAGLRMGKRSHKERSSKEHKSKNKLSKDKRDKKDRHRSGKERRHKRRRSSSVDSSSSDGGASPRLSTAQQLAMGRAAARSCREILAHDYGLRKDLRELARQLDDGGALDVSGLPNTFLRARLEELLGNLPSLRRSAVVSGGLDARACYCSRCLSGRRSWLPLCARACPCPPVSCCRAHTTCAGESLQRCLPS